MKLAARCTAVIVESVLLLTALVVAMPSRAEEVQAADGSSAGRKLENIMVYGAPIEDVIAQTSTSAGKMDIPILETPMSISVLTEERMEELGVLTVQDTYMYSAGVSGGPFGTDTRGDWVTIRGSEPIQYVDGLKSLFGFYNNTRINPYALSRVEILKGPASVLYGQGSTGGIVNLVSKLPEAERRSEIWTQYGNYDRMQVAADATGSIDAGGAFLYRFVGLWRDSEMQTDHVPDDSLVLSPSLTWNATDRTTLTFLLNYQDNESGTGTQFLPWEGTIFPGPEGDLDFDLFLSEPGWDKYDTTQTAGTVLFDHAFNDIFSLHVAARYTDGSADYNSMWPTFPPTIQPDNTVTREVYVSRADSEAWTLDARVQAKFATGSVDHNIVAGFDYQDAMTDNDFYYGFMAGGTIDVYDPVYGNIPVSTPVSDFPSTTDTQQGFYFQDHMKIVDHWIVTLAARIDDIESNSQGPGGAQEDDNFTGRAGLMYLFEMGLAPYFSYTQSFNPVIGTDLAGHSYKPVEGEQFEIGLKYQSPGSAGIYTLALYDLAEKNRLTSDPANPFNSLQSGEIGTQGIELEAQFAWRDFNALASYSYTDAKYTKSNDGNDGNHLENIPDHLFSTWVSWRPSASWQGFHAGAGVRYVGASWDGADVIKVPDYTLVDAMVGYDVGRWSFSVDVDNLADNKYIASCLARGDCFLGSRRTVSANVRFNF